MDIANLRSHGIAPPSPLAGEGVRGRVRRGAEASPFPSLAYLQHFRACHSEPERSEESPVFGSSKRREPSSLTALTLVRPPYLCNTDASCFSRGTGTNAADSCPDFHS